MRVKIKADWIGEGGHMEFTGTIADPEGKILAFMQSAPQSDDRPYAVLCGQCGRAISDADACCKFCGASNRPCSACRHLEPDESCTSADCNNNSRWEERI